MAKILQMPEPGGVAVVRLNHEQRAAVQHGEGPLLVVAGAGTGKTRVITERIRYLLESQPELPGEAILGLTFTEKAAAEMRHRVARVAGERGERVWLGTYHAFCHDLLTQLNPALRVLDEMDYWVLLRRNLPRLDLKHYMKLADPGRFLSDFTQFFSRCQDELVTPEDYQAYVDELAQSCEREKDKLEPEERAAREAEVARQREVARAFGESEQMLRERNVVTFGGLLLRAVMELRSNPDLLGLLQERYRYILVDEFQDSNIAQIELLWLLAGSRRNVMAVGDDDQAIYRFRGASFGSFKLFAEKFAAGNPSPKLGESVSLRQNYRSTQRILRVADEVIRHNQDRYLPDKKLFTRNAEGQHIRIAEFANADAEAAWVVREIERLHGEGRPWSDCAVLYRMHTHRDGVVTELRRRGIPFVIRNLSILENPLVRDVIAYLRLIDNLADDVACARVLAAPAWRLDAAGLVRLLQRTDHRRGRGLWDVLADAQGDLPFVRDNQRIAELQMWIGGLHTRAKFVPASDIVDGLIEGLQLKLLPTDSDRRYLERLLKFIAEWERKSETKKLSELVEYLGYFQEANEIIALEEESNDDAVQLMTVHGAKGLEFSHVFILRLSRGAFPANRRRPVLEFPVKLMKELLPEGDFHIQEERRLFYVALTRARHGVTLTTVVHKRSKASPFLDDILMNTDLAKRDVVQLAPVVDAAPQRAVQLFPKRTGDSRVYSRIGEWAQEFHPPAAEPIQLSASAIETYDRCPMKYLLGNVWGLEGRPQAAMTFGNVMHTTIKEFVAQVHKGHRITFEDVAAVYERNWSDAGFRDAYQRDEYKKAGLQQLRAFCEAYLAAPPRVLEQERTFALSMENNVIVTGRIDQINRVGKTKKQVEIVDYKTGTPKEEKAAEKSLQLSLYALGAREVLGYDPVRLVFYNLSTNDAVATTRDERALAEAQDTVQEVAVDIRAGEFPAKSGFWCRYCEFQPVCPEHEQPANIVPSEE